MVFIWGQAEPNATIIAASIPVLRVLFRDMHRSKYGHSSGGVNGSRGPGAGGYLRSDNGSKFHRTATTVEDGVTGCEHKGDGDSERSILGREVLPSSGLKGGDIVKTTEVVIGYERGHGEHGARVGESFEMTDRSRARGFDRAM